MATVRLRNVNPLGYVDLPLVNRQAGSDDEPGSERFEADGVSCLIPGEVFEVDDKLAGRAPSGQPGSEDYDPGEGLLAQVGNYELVNDFPDGDPAESWRKSQLEAYAVHHRIDIASASNKAEILAAIKKG